MHRALWLGLLLGACGPKDGTVEQGACLPIEEADALPEASHEVLINRTSSSSQREWTQVITNPSEWMLFLSTLRPPAPSDPFVDFETQRVLVARTGSSSTCGILLDDFKVLDTGDGVLLDLRTSDPSATCRGGCGNEVEYVVAVAIPRDGLAQACARRVDSCSPPAR